MTGPITESELRRRCRNEDAHTSHVARLARRLFDGTRQALGLEAGNRVLLDYACRLHDVGFAGDPASHADRGARIVGAENIRGLTPEQRGVVAAAISLHSGGAPGRRTNAWLARLPPRQRRLAVETAALLRVADALDHGHVQDAALESVKVGGGGIRLRVRCAAYPGNIAYANAKADLWNEVLPIPVRAVAARGSVPMPGFARILGKRDAAPEALRKIMCLQGRIMVDSRNRALTREDPEDLHDLRVAMRRFRAAVRLYRQEWPDRQAARVITELFAFSTRVGPIRDAQVWLQFLEQARVRRRCEGDPGWDRYLRAVRRDTEREIRRLRRLVSGPEWLRPADRVVRYLRVDVPALVRTMGHVSFRSFGAAKIRRLLKRILAHRVRPAAMPPEEFHELRRLCRRARYGAEFLAPVSGAVVGELATRLKAVCDALGRLHDADLQTARLAARTRDDLPSLRAILCENRETALGDFKNAWKALRRREFRNAVFSRLDLMRTRR